MKTDLSLGNAVGIFKDRHLCLYMATAALLWFLMFSPWTKGMASFWTLMSISACVLSVIALVVSFLLALVNSFTAPIIEENQKAGMIITADQYPFTGGSAPLISQIPPKYLTEGKETGLRRLVESAELRRQAEWSIFHETDEFESNIYSAGYAGCLIAGAYTTAEHVGKTLAQLAEETGKAPFDAAIDLLAANEGIVQGIYFSQNQSDLLRFLSQPWVMAGSDWSD